LVDDHAVKALAGEHQIKFGSQLGITAGPVGREIGGDLNFSYDRGDLALSYSFSKGLFAGINLEGAVVGARPKVNKKFYGKDVKASEILYDRSVVIPENSDIPDLHKKLDLLKEGKTNEQKDEDLEKEESKDKLGDDVVYVDIKEESGKETELKEAPIESEIKEEEVTEEKNVEKEEEEDKENKVQVDVKEEKVDEEIKEEKVEEEVKEEKVEEEVKEEKVEEEVKEEKVEEEVKEEKVEEEVKEEKVEEVKEEKVEEVKEEKIEEKVKEEETLKDPEVEIESEKINDMPFDEDADVQKVEKLLKKSIPFDEVADVQ